MYAPVRRAQRSFAASYKRESDGTCCNNRNGAIEFRFFIITCCHWYSMKTFADSTFHMDIDIFQPRDAHSYNYVLAYVGKGRMRMIARRLGLCIDVLAYIMQSMPEVDIDMMSAAFGGKVRSPYWDIGMRAADLDSVSLARYALGNGMSNKNLLNHAVVQGAVNIIDACGYAPPRDEYEEWIKHCTRNDDAVTFHALMKHIPAEASWYDHLSTAISLNHVNMFKSLLPYVSGWHYCINELIKNNREGMIDYAFKHFGGEIHGSEIARAIKHGNKSLAGVILKHCARGQLRVLPFGVGDGTFYPLKVYSIPPLGRDNAVQRAKDVIWGAQKQVACGRNPRKR
jgi:hypothetical protein